MVNKIRKKKKGRIILSYRLKGYEEWKEDNKGEI